MTTNSYARGIAKIKATTDRFLDRLRVRRVTRHVSGPRRITLADHDVALVCMLKNGSYYLDELISHHRGLGIEHFLFIDNGSDDDTVPRLSQEKGVTVVSNTLPVAKYESLLRGQIAKQMIKGGWFLFVDTDELIDFIGGENWTIQDYVEYCDAQDFTAIVGQSLDLFSSSPMDESAGWSYRESIERFDRYSLENIQDLDYHDPHIPFAWFLRNNRSSNPAIKIKFGGIRNQLFGEDCALTKHSMVKNNSNIELYSHPHCSGNVYCADFTLLLRHYKFAGRYLSREQQQIWNKTWEHRENERRLSVIQNKNFRFEAENVQTYAGTGTLLHQGFLNSSDRFSSRFLSN